MHQIIPCSFKSLMGKYSTAFIAHFFIISVSGNWNKTGFLSVTQGDLEMVPAVPKYFARVPVVIWNSP